MTLPHSFSDLFASEANRAPCRPSMRRVLADKLSTQRQFDYRAIFRCELDGDCSVTSRCGTENASWGDLNYGTHQEDKFYANASPPRLVDLSGFIGNRRGSLGASHPGPSAASTGQ